VRDVTVICGHNTISMLWGNMAYCAKLCGDDLSHYSNKIESVGLTKCPYDNLLRSAQQTFLRACPTPRRKSSWHRYGTTKLRHCDPFYRFRLEAVLMQRDRATRRSLAPNCIRKSHLTRAAIGYCKPCQMGFQLLPIVERPLSSLQVRS